MPLRDPNRTMTVSVTRLAINIIAMAVVFVLTLFLPAGTLAWPAGWAYLVLFFGFTVAIRRQVNACVKF